MPNTSSFTEFLSSIAGRGRSILGISPSSNAQSNSHVEIIELCHQLLSSKGEASGIALSFEVLNRYKKFDIENKTKFFFALYDQFSANQQTAQIAARKYLEEPTVVNLSKLASVAEPTRRQLIIRLNQAPNATQSLLEMRADLLDLVPEHRELEQVDEDFVKLFSSWFNGGFLELRSLNWSSPATLLQKIIQYEAVHGMMGLEDLQQRLDPPDRRVYGFFHPRLGDEPLIFMEVALVVDMPSAISSILKSDRIQIDPQAARTATFYSISNCQKGLRGIPLGSFLIKQVVEDLKKDYPDLKEYVTLSPVPGFAKWVNELADDDTRSITGANKAVIDLSKSIDSSQLSGVAGTDAEQTLTSLAAWYLCKAKTDGMRLPDPVARFHFGNGARLERINWAADLSKEGISNSFGIMVNYSYRLDEIEQNHEEFVHEGEVIRSPAVNRLANSIDVKMNQIKNNIAV